MSRHKDFGSGADPAELEPITFTLDGQTFTCHAVVQGFTLLRFVADADSEDGGRAAAAIYNFFKNVMSTEEYTRLEALLTTPEKYFDIDKLGEIVAWLSSEYASRPTQPSESSESGA